MERSLAEQLPDEKTAAVLGVPVAALASTALLMVSPDLLDSGCGPGGDLEAGDVVAVVTSGRHHLLPSVLASVLGINELLPAGEEVRAALLQVAPPGAPLGLPAGVVTFVDVALAPHPSIWVQGLRGADDETDDGTGTVDGLLRTNYDELLRLTEGHPVELG